MNPFDSTPPIGSPLEQAQKVKEQASLLTSFFQMMEENAPEEHRVHFALPVRVRKVQDAAMELLKKSAQLTGDADHEFCKKAVQVLENAICEIENLLNMTKGENENVSE